jgi:hypothetical protein
MKINEPGNQDKALRKVLHEWRPEVSLPPHFQEKVWLRIERAQAPARPSVWMTITHWIGTALPRPVLAVSYVAVLLTVGISAGWAQAHKENARVKDALGQRYVRALDPFQAPRN